MITLEIPALLKQYTDGNNSLELSASPNTNLLSVIKQVTNQYPPLNAYLLTNDQQLVSFASFYINGRDARSLDQENTLVNDSDTISIILAIAGG